MRWIDRPPRSTDVVVDNDDDDDDEASEVSLVDHGSERFEFTLKRYWPTVTEMSLQCVLTACSVTAIKHTSHQSSPAVITLHSITGV